MCEGGPYIHTHIIYQEDGVEAPWIDLRTVDP